MKSRNVVHRRARERELFAMPEILGRVRGSSLAKNAVALYSAHIAGLVLPLIAIPYLARVLRPESWGVVIFSQSFAAPLILILDYGFYLSATREIARKRENPEHLAQIVSEVQSAKAVLILGVTGLTLVAYFLVPLFRANPAHLFWAWCIAAAQGLSTYWYFQGVERMTFPALTEAVTKGIATALLLVFVQTPNDGARVLAIYAVAAFVWIFLTQRRLYREVPLLPLHLRSGLRRLRDGARVFAFRATSGFLSTANSFVLGAMVGPQIVAFFGGAERVIRGAINLIHPATQAVYPRVSFLVVDDRSRASRLLGLSMLMVGGLGLGLGLIAEAGAPLLVSVLLGPGYESAVPVLRLLAALPPMIAVSTVLGLQWALPLGHDRAYLYIVVSGAALNICLAILLVPRFGAMGMAGSIVSAESFVLGGLVVLAWRHGRDLWRDALESILEMVHAPVLATSVNAAPAPPFVSQGQDRSLVSSFQEEIDTSDQIALPSGPRVLE
jgi:PST family polysaccharide transporter